MSLFFLLVHICKPIFLGIPSCRKTVVVCARIHHCASRQRLLLRRALVVALAYQIYNEYSSKGFHLACLLTLASMCARDAQCSVEYLQSACPFDICCYISPPARSISPVHANDKGRARTRAPALLNQSQSAEIKLSKSKQKTKPRRNYLRLLLRLQVRAVS